ncbi:MAG: alpha/beta hydrolase [Proteobacteria bacterium]|nr:MAG: alpha/beta hydrolase [Pseudomonadota bacterium]
MPWPWLFLAVTIVGALFTFNAYLPRPAHGSWLAVPSFFAGWLTAELVAHHFAWQLAATVFFVAMGALDAWPGWLGLGITAASWAALLAMVPVARRSGDVVEEALRQGLGPDYLRTSEPAEALLRASAAVRAARWNPFDFRHPDVEVARDIAYATEAGPRHMLDVYYPRTGIERAPVLLQIHGGGWTIGHKRQQALPLMLHLAARGWICVAANYRLSPKATFPDHLVDVKRAIAWIRAHAADYGADADFLAVTGGSAGGHLAALAGLTANDPEYQPGFESADTSVQACVPFYGVYDFTDSQRLDPRRQHMRFMERVVMKKKFDAEPAAFERASPLFRVHPDAPPFFIVHGALDSLVPAASARHFAAKLREVSKQPVCYAELPHAQHAFEVFHSLRTHHVVRAVDRFLAWTWARHRGRAASSDAA